MCFCRFGACWPFGRAREVESEMSEQYESMLAANEAENDADNFAESQPRNPSELIQSNHNHQKSSIIPNSMYSDGKVMWDIVQDGRVLRVFMSSTFRDMQKERDTFFRNAEKKLKDHATKKGLVLVFIDLRWGLTNEISEAGQVVLSCLRAIEQCPYFLCTLGSRYGWSPNHEIPSEWHPETDLMYPYLKEMRGLSVTDYEIVHGALRENAVARRAFFYSRDEDYAVNHIAENETERDLYRPANAKDMENQDGLKKKISIKFDMKPYKTPIELVKMIADDLVIAIDEDFPYSQMDSEDAAHDQFLRHRLIGLEGRDHIISFLTERTMQQLNEADSDITIVGAESGMGKSSIMSGLVRDLKALKNPNLVVMYHFVGCSNSSNYVENLVERVARILIEKGLLSFKMDSEKGKKTIKKGLGYILQLASRNEGKQTVLVIDALNQLADSQQYPHAHRLEWLPKRTPRNLSIIVSTIDSHASCRIASSMKLDFVPISKLDDEGITKATNQFFGRYNKSLTSKQMQMILDDREDTGHPLYLRIVLDELRVFGVYEKVDIELGKLLKTKGTIDLFNLVMNRWENKYGRNLVRLSISVLYISRVGLNENELDKYLEHRLNQMKQPFNIGAWKSFLFVLLESLFVRNGRYTFSHHLLVESVKKRYFKEEIHLKREACAYGYWMLKEYGAETTEKGEIAEICYNLRISGEYKKLASYMTNKKVVIKLLYGIYRFEFYECWRVLNKNGFDHKIAYRDIAKQLNHAGYALVGYFKDVQENEFLIPILKHRISIDADEGSKSENITFLGDVYNNLGKFEKALQCFHESLETRLRVYGEVHPDVAESYGRIGLVYKQLEKYDQALEHCQKDVEITLKVYGELHPDVASSYSKLGLVYKNLRKYDKALEYYQKSLEIRLKVFGTVHPDVAESYGNIGKALRKLGRQEEGLEYCQKDLEITLKVYGEEHPYVAKGYGNIGNIYKNLGRYEQALDYFQKSLRITSAIFDEKHPDIANCLYYIADLYEHQNNYKDAMEYFERARVEYECVFGADSSRTKLMKKRMADLRKKPSK